jgi:hypothetical protein
MLQRMHDINGSEGSLADQRDYSRQLRVVNNSET